jgi:hypothetical protein
MLIDISEGSVENTMINEILKVYPHIYKEHKDVVLGSIAAMYLLHFPNNFQFVDLPPEASKVINENVEDILG